MIVKPAVAIPAVAPINLNPQQFDLGVQVRGKISIKTGPGLVNNSGGILSVDPAFITALIPVTPPPVIPPITNVKSWTKANGLKDAVSGIAADVAIPSGVIVESIGYNAAGNPVYQATAAALQADFFSSVVTAADTVGLPNGTADRTKEIRRDGSIGLRVDPRTTLDVDGSFATRLFNVPIAGDYTVTDLDSTINVLTTNGNSTLTRVITFPAASAWPRRILTVHATGTNYRETINVVASGGLVEGQTGELSASQQFNARHVRSRTYQSDGFNWQLIGQVETTLRYSYKDPNPRPAIVANKSTVPAANINGNDVTIPNGTSYYETTDAQWLGGVALPPVDATSVPITIARNSAWGLYVLETNTDLSESLQIELGQVARFYPGGDGRWHWIDPEINAPIPVRSRFDPLWAGAPATGNIPPEARVWVMRDGNYANPLTLPPVSNQSEPLTIVSSATFAFVVSTTNQVPGSIAQNGTRSVPLVYYPTFDGWLLAT